MKTMDMNKKNQRKRIMGNLAGWTLAWTLSIALATFGHKLLWDGNKALTIAAIVISLLIGVGMIMANRRFIEHSDELEKKIQLESMGLTLGLTLVVGLAYSLLDITNVIPWDAEISFLVIFMGICYMASILVNNNRYR
jgi:hypothetical protein